MNMKRLKIPKSSNNCKTKTYNTCPLKTSKNRLPLNLCKVQKKERKLGIKFILHLPKQGYSFYIEKHAAF